MDSLEKNLLIFLSEGIALSSKRWVPSPFFASFSSLLAVAGEYFLVRFDVSPWLDKSTRNFLTSGSKTSTTLAILRAQPIGNFVNRLSSAEETSWIGRGSEYGALSSAARDATERAVFEFLGRLHVWELYAAQ